MSIRRLKGSVLAMIGISAMAFPATAAPAQAPPKPQQSTPQASTSTLTFDDWLVRCESRPPAPKICEVAQAIVARAANQQQNVIAEIAFGHLGKSDSMKLVVQLPVGVWLPPGATFVLGDGSAIALPYSRCAQSCFAEAELQPEVIQALRGWTKAEPARLDFQDGAQRKVSLTVSLKGLAAALAARDDQAGR